MEEFEYKLPEGFTKKFYEAHKDLIVASAKEVYRCICKTDCRRFKDWLERRPSADAIGHILGILFAADDWEAAVVCYEIFTNDEIREEIYNQIWDIR